MVLSSSWLNRPSSTQMLPGGGTLASGQRSWAVEVVAAGAFRTAADRMKAASKNTRAREVFCTLPSSGRVVPA